MRCHHKEEVDHSRLVVAALGRLVDRFDAYLCHLAAMSEDRSIRSTDRKILKGYLLK